MTEENQIIEETKPWKALYYKENALVGVLKAEIQAFEAQVEYLKSELAYTRRYGVNND